MNQSNPPATSNVQAQNTQDWQPNCSHEILKIRAQWFKKIRHYFEQEGVLEVDTPALSHYSVSESGLQPFTTNTSSHQKLYLQTSPEYAMKRLLADGSGSIYQLSKVFRNNELGQQHNPEFMMLEWYRTQWDYLKLIKEVDQLMQLLANTRPLIQNSYQQLFIKYLNIDPHDTTLQALEQAGNTYLELNDSSLSFTDWLEILFDYCIHQHQTSNTTKTLDPSQPLAITEFPRALAQLADTGPAQHTQTTQPVAYRFEIYWRGVELANGYQELTCPQELSKRWQLQRATPDNGTSWASRQDPRLLAAMSQGLPECSGCALGFDRLLFTEQQTKNLSDILTFNA